jgi:hypothetical protein
VRVEFVDEEKASPVYTDVLNFSTYTSPTYAKGYFKVPAGKFYMAIWCYAMTDASAPRDFHIDDLRLIKRLFKLPTPIAQVDAAQDGSTKIRWSGDEVESVRYSTSTVSMPSAPTGGSGGDGIDSTGTFAGDTIGFEGIEYVALVGYSNTDGTGVEAEPVFLEIEKSAPDDTDDLTQGTVRKVVDAKYLDADAKPEKLVIQPDQGRTHLVLNADAEVGDPLTLGVPPYWGNDGGSTYLALESVSPISGDYSLKLSAAAAADQGFWPVLAYEGDRGATATDATEMPLLPVEEGDILRLLLTAKSDGTAGSDLRAYVRKWGPDKTHIGTAFFVQSDTTDLKWTPADTTAIARWGSYTVPSGTAFVNIELNVLKPTSGTAVWLADDLYLRRYVPLDQEVYGDLPAGTGLADSGAVRPLARGRQSGQDQDTDASVNKAGYESSARERRME